jgi:hypothetical protein
LLTPFRGASFSPRHACAVQAERAAAVRLQSPDRHRIGIEDPCYVGLRFERRWGPVVENGDNAAIGKSLFSSPRRRFQTI